MCAINVMNLGALKLCLEMGVCPYVVDNKGESLTDLIDKVGVMKPELKK